MFSSVGVPELVLVFVIGLLILGPERLPRVASQIGRWVGKARRTANQLRYQMEREIALADIERTKPRPQDSAKEKAPDEAGAAGSHDGDAAAESAAKASDDATNERSPAGTATGDQGGAAPTEQSRTSETTEADADKS